jgi:hypothetical protein
MLAYKELQYYEEKTDESLKLNMASSECYRINEVISDGIRRI